MVCTDRQLTDAQKAAGFNPRTGVDRAIRPFQGPPTPENLMDYINRELFPALQAARRKLNEVYLQVADQAPSANPLSYYFSTATANADPTSGFIRLDAATQDTATTIRVSQSNARQHDTAAWLDVMAGSATAPLGVVTIVDAVNPGRFIRFDLTAMVDQGAYWDLTVTPVESSHDNPFVEGEGVVISFIAGVSSGTTVIAPGSAPAWSSVLAAGATSGANNPIVDVGQFLQLGLVGPTTSSPQIRSGDATFRIRGGGNTFVFADGAASIAGLLATAADGIALVQAQGASGLAELVSGGAALVQAATTIALSTGGSGRLVIAADGEWTTPAGSSGQFFRHAGAATPPTWSTLALTDLPSQAADTFLGRLAGSGTPTAQLLADVDSTSIIYDAASHTFQRAAISGAVTAAQNVNTTTYSGIRSNGSLQTAQPFINVVNTTSITGDAGVDGAAQEIEFSFQRAALTGAIAAPANSNATVFSGVLNNGAATTDQPNMNFVSTTSIIADVGNDGPNQEMEVNFQRAALTGEVTAAANANATTVVRSTDFQTTPWTGAHQFDSNVRFNGTFEFRQRQDITLAADADDVDMTADNVLRLVGNGFSLTGMVPLSPGNGQTVQIFNTDSGDPLIITHDDSASTAANRFFCPGSADFVLSPRSAVWARYDDTSDRWYLLTNPSYGKLIAISIYSANDTHTWDTSTRLTIIDVQASGAGGRSATAAAGQLVAGAGGGSGGFRRCWYVPTTATLTISVAAGGAADNAGGNVSCTDGTLTSACQGGAAATGVMGSGTVVQIDDGGVRGTGGTTATLGTTILTTTGETGGSSIRLSGTVGVSGKGGNAPCGSMGGSQRATAGVGVIGGGPGSGGSGALSDSATARTAGAGVTGFVLIYEFSF